ncbi:MAG TPA: helix-turn-helix transcriptional regulator [Streptomyces sp.]|uniref:helix-turn-helix domain-containing protein n=1 Tax=Streptomyces sp. TaxID=1931 RepID=UPI002D104012|nr:helix-turn-helix transcriptional regulator [Streptomyces sp.]HWU09640.1 helix-turn-helix transcriptional regulator [Streptomyces sp.]
MSVQDPMTAVPAAWLLQRARTEPSTQTVLARFLGVTQPSVHRYFTGEREPTFADLQRLIAGMGCRLELLVRTEPQPVFPFQEDRITARQPYRVKEPVLARLLPPSLQREHGGFPADVPDGPTPGEALGWLCELRALTRQAAGPRRRLEALGDHRLHPHDERLLRRLKPVGSGVRQAVTALACAIDHAAQRAGREERRPRRSRREIPDHLGRQTWAHAVACVLAEATICAGLARTLPAENRYLAAELDELAQHSTVLYRQAAATAPFTAWRAELDDPHYLDWLDGGLQS